MNFSWCQNFMNRFWLGVMFHDFLFETDGVGLLFALLPFAAVGVIYLFRVLNMNGGGKDE